MRCAAASDVFPARRSMGSFIVPPLPSDRDLRAELDHAVGRQVIEAGGRQRVGGQLHDRASCASGPARNARAGTRVSRPMKKVAVSTSSARPKRRALVQRLRHVGRFEEAVMHAHGVKALAQLLHFDALFAAGTSGVSSTTTLAMTTRSCSTLLCLRLCSSAPGTTSVRDDRNTRQCRRRASALLSARSRNRSQRQGFAAHFFQMDAAAAPPGVHHR